MDRLPRLFTCSTHRDATIDTVLTSPDSRGVREWNVTFVQAFNDWEVAEVVEFFQLLNSHVVTNSGPDGLRWTLCKAGVFDSRSFYLALIDRPGESFPWKSIWAVKAPPCVAFFIWTAAWGRILTCDNLMRHGFTKAGCCCMCCCDGETVDHLLLHCNTAYVIWSIVFNSFGIHWVMLQRVLDLLFGWRNWFGKLHSNIWNLVPLCLMWTLWRERNSRTFEEKSSTPDQLLEVFVNSLFDCSRVWGFTTASSVPEFVVSLHSVFSLFWCICCFSWVHILCTFEVF